MAREVNLAFLLGRAVVDRAGRTLGRIEEIRAERDGRDAVVVEYLVGAYGLLERLSAWPMGRIVRRLFGRTHEYRPYVIGWDQLDLSDPQRPRLRVNRSELSRVA
jgi:hypothetical protein